jgi:hypothetical protein
VGLFRINSLDAGHPLGFLRQYPGYLYVDLLQGKELGVENSLADIAGYIGQPGKLCVRAYSAFQAQGQQWFKRFFWQAKWITAQFGYW